MEITFLGQAGLSIQTEFGSVLCDPWFNPAFFASWFPFPRNDGIDPQAIGSPTYLYISHLHQDHFDPQFLREHVSKEATVLLPDYPLPYLEDELRRIGFRDFVHTSNGVPVELGGLRIAIVALTTPSDGPIGDSGLVVDDGKTRIFNQNDSHPANLEGLAALGPFHGHFLQFSGGIWFPMVYNFPPRMKATLGRRKRANQQARAHRYAQEVGATHVFPSSGPACFLDDDLFSMNDFDRDPTNIFCDQSVFLEYMAALGDRRGRLIVPGSVITLEGDRCSVRHPTGNGRVDGMFTDKRGYLSTYRRDKMPLIEAVKATWPRGRLDVLPALQEWFEPLLDMAELTSAGVNGRVLLDCGDERVVVDFIDRRVYRWDGQACRYRFWVDRSLVESCILDGTEDWVNGLFLSCRFAAERDGPYNEFVYNFFKCLSPERMAYAEGCLAEQQASPEEVWRFDGYEIQRRCPHLKADLTRFGQVDGGVLTCTMHGWQFDLDTGRCLTADDRKLQVKRA